MLLDSVMDVAGPFSQMEISMMETIARVADMALAYMFSKMVLDIMGNTAVEFAVVVASLFIPMDPFTRAIGVSI